MDAEKAQQMMADAIKAMIDCGQYKAAHAVATKTTVHGQTADVMCLLFGAAPEILEAIALRVGDSSIDERIAASLTNDAIARAAGKS